MNQYVAQLPWTDEQWARVTQTVKQEAERTRVAAKFLPIYGPVDPSEMSVENLTLTTAAAPGGGVPAQRLEINSLPGTELTRISSLVYVRGHEAADPELQAVLSMFRRTANAIARVEDSLMFNGNTLLRPLTPVGGATYDTDGPMPVAGLLPRTRAQAAALVTEVLVQSPNNANLSIQQTGTGLVTSVVQAINRMDAQGYAGPYACVLAEDLYQSVHTPTPNLVLPRHTILPLLEGGPILRSSRIQQGWGVVVAYESGQVEQVLATDICVTLLQVSLEPRFVFRVSERVALRVRDPNCYAVLHP